MSFSPKQKRYADRRTSASDEHVHARCGATYRGTNGEDENESKEDGLASKAGDEIADEGDDGS